MMPTSNRKLSAGCTSCRQHHSCVIVVAIVYRVAVVMVCGHHCLWPSILVLLEIVVRFWGGGGGDYKILSPQYFHWGHGG